MLFFLDSPKAPTLIKIRMQSAYNETHFGLSESNLFVDIILVTFMTSLPSLNSLLTTWCIVKKREKHSKIVSVTKIALLKVGNVLFVGLLTGAAFTSKCKSEVDDHNHNLLMAITARSLPILVLTYKPVIITLC